MFDRNPLVRFESKITTLKSIIIPITSIWSSGKKNVGRAYFRLNEKRKLVMFEFFVGQDRLYESTKAISFLAV